MFQVPLRRNKGKQARQSFQGRSEAKHFEKSKLFLRNRTLVGSSPESVGTSSEYRANIQSHRAQLHHLNLRRRKLIVALLYVILSLVMVTWFIYEYTGRIQLTVAVDVQTSKEFESNKVIYTRAVNDYLNAHPLERLRFVLRHDDLLKYINAIAPEIDRINVSQSSEPMTSQININFRRPVAGWLINTKQYYVDKDGLAFQVNYFEQPNVKIIDKNLTNDENGNTIASTRFLRFVGRTVETSRTLGLIVEQVIIPQGTTRQLELIIKDKEYPVKMSVDRPVGEQVEDMQRAISYIEVQKLDPKYVDVRVSGKAFYKM